MNREELENSLKTSWTWYLFVAANFLLMLGIAISWIIISKWQVALETAFLPTIICGILSVASLCAFFYYDSKDFYVFKMHVNKKWVKVYFASGIIFIIALIFSAAMFSLYQIITGAGLRANAFFLITFCVTSFLSLLSIGTCRFGRFKIAFDIYKRRRGEIEAIEKQAIDQKEAKEKLSDEEFKQIKATIDDKNDLTKGPTSSLIDHAEKQ